MTEDKMVGGLHQLDVHELSKLWEIVEEKESGMGHPMGSKSRTQG